MIEAGLEVAWLALFGLVLVARLLDTRPGRRFLRARASRLADWWSARQRLSDADQEFEEMWAVMRREQLSAHLQRLRRIVATDESMSATRQIANRLAYRSIVRDLEKLTELTPWMADDESALGWTPSTYHSHGTYSSQPRQVEVLEIGRRR